MPEPVGLLVVAAEGSAPLARLRRSLTRHPADLLPLTVVPTAADALAVAAEGRVATWVVLDSGLQLIRPLLRSDVMADDVTPFTFASEERERLVAGGDPDEGGYGVVRAELPLADGRRLRCRGLGTWSADVVRAWQAEWLQPRDWSFADALERCPDAHAWYLGWVLSSRPSQVVLREPIVAMLDTPAARRELDILGATTADLARAYVGVVLAGTEESDALAGPPDRARVVAGSMPMRELGRAFVLRCTRKAPRVQRWLGLTARG